jgi:tight adherence protein B
MIELVAAMMGAVTVFVAVGALTGQFGYSQRRIAARAVTLQRHASDEAKPLGAVLLKEDSLGEASSLNKALRRFAWSERRAKLLDKADLPLKVSEYLIIAALTFALVAVLVTVISGLLAGGLILGAAAVVALELWVSSRARRRLSLFNKQLPLALESMSVSLKSGFGVMEAVATVVREMDPPLSNEFQRVLDEARVGGSFEGGLASMVERVDSADLRIVARALEIHRKIGGDLAEILEQVATTMREREELRGHIAALTAQQRLGGMIVGLLPAWVFGVFLVFDPELISPLWEEDTGRILLLAIVLMDITSFFAMRKIMSIEV